MAGQGIIINNNKNIINEGVTRPDSELKHELMCVNSSIFMYDANFKPIALPQFLFMNGRGQKIHNTIPLVVLSEVV